MSATRRPAAARLRRPALACGTLLAAAALSLTAARSAAARPYDPPAAPQVPLSQMLTQLHTDYEQTEAATQAYDQAKETADRLRAAARTADARLAAQRTAVADARTQLGLMANQMYRDGGLSPYLSFLGGMSPQEFFGSQHVAAQLVGQQKSVLARLAHGQARLAQLNTQAQKALDGAEHAQSTAAARKKTVQTRLDQVETTLAGLTGVQIDQLQALEQADTDKAQSALMDSKALGDDPALRTPSKVGARALDYALTQVGKPYQWGAQGPDSFDCSGLTSQAWAHAGTVIPRTSQEQWQRLPHVPLALLRPGDLVIYFKGATHVAIYAGDGMVVEAPRPGADIKVAPIAANPVLGAVRPDSAQPPLAGWTAPDLGADTDQGTPFGMPATGAQGVKE
ncbi:C40 family peptidase [Actinacidiphila yeochonensis]|uniref:C40 family peptidase n=1 Tax=Actinacidiphila yeochonensis TaxID=89050 RepID=UPI0007C7AAF5|nr:C40 family peptidase [Actinacidiphila yeochonensis]